MNAYDLQHLQEFRQKLEDMAGPLINQDLPVAIVLFDILKVLNVGEEDMIEVLGEDVIRDLDKWHREVIAPLPPELMAYRSALTNFEPSKTMQEYGLTQVTRPIPKAVWDALEETFDERYVNLVAVVLDQNSRTVWKGVCNGDCILSVHTLIAEQRTMAEKAARKEEVDGRV